MSQCDENARLDDDPVNEKSLVVDLFVWRSVQGV